MNLRIEQVEYGELAPFRELYRKEVNCQIIHDSILGRGWADGYLIRVDGEVAGYGGHGTGSTPAA